MIFEALPDIPRILTAFAEWAACLVFILVVKRRLGLGPSLINALAALPILIAVQLWAATLPLDLWVVGMMVAAGTMLTFIGATAHASLAGVGFLGVRAFVLAELVASFEWQLHTFFFESRELGAEDDVFAFAFYAVCFVGAYFLERRHFDSHERLDVPAPAVLVSVMSGVLTFLMSNLSFISANTPFSGRVGAEIFYIRTLVDLVGYAVLYAQQGQRVELRRAVEVAVMDGLLRSQHEQYLRSKATMEEVNRKYHDLKHYIYAIRAETNDAQRARYVDQLEDSIRDYESNAFDTGSGVLDAVLTAKSSEATRRGVHLTSVVDGASVDFIDAMDLTTIFGNALDNAIEAAATVTEPEKRLVNLAVFRKEQFLAIRVENYFTGELHMRDDLPVTTKADHANHGYGMRNMRQAVERYDGTLVCGASDAWFTVRILIPVDQA